MLTLTRPELLPRVVMTCFDDEDGEKMLTLTRPELLPRVVMTCFCVS